jgi:transcriptional regulator with XRE-family HTH domain
MNLRTLGELVRTRRTELGLSQAQLGQLCHLSRTTINLLENGTLSDLGVVKTMQLMDTLGLQLQASKPLSPNKKKALRMASVSASVSYKEKIKPPRIGPRSEHRCHPAQTPASYCNDVGRTAAKYLGGGC